MSDSNKTEYEHQLKLNGEPLTRGDSTSIAVVFNNLSGINFSSDRAAWRSMSHQDYLEMMQAEWAVDLTPGALLTMLTPAGEVVASHIFPTPDANHGHSPTAS